MMQELHHGVQRLGVVCHDSRSHRPRYFTADLNSGLPLSDIVRGSASIPHLFPPVPVLCGETWFLTDGGVSDPVPIAFAREAIGATHVIVSDCRLIGRVPPLDSTTVWIRPRMTHTGTLWSPRRELLASIAAGEDAVTPDVLAHFRASAAATRHHSTPRADIRSA